MILYYIDDVYLNDFLLMNNYGEYTAIDFAADTDFIMWVRSPEANRDIDHFWAEWLKMHPEKKAEVLEARRLVALFDENHSFEDRRAPVWGRIESSLSDIESPEKTKSGQLIARDWGLIVKYAAVLLIFLMVGTFWYLNRNGTSDNDNQAMAQTTLYQNVNLKPRTVLLSDGSSVILYQNTKLEVLSDFKQEQRRVKVDGKAYFEIVRDETRPFIVYAKELTTRVLGTSFLISAYDRQNVTVAVNSGRVSVSQIIHDTNKNMEVVLEKNEAVALAVDAEFLERIDMNELEIDENYYSDDFEFKDASLVQVFSLIESRYGVEIFYKEDQISSCFLNASLSGIPLEDKLRLICKGSNLSYSMKNNNIIIEGAGCTAM